MSIVIMPVHNNYLSLLENFHQSGVTCLARTSVCKTAASMQETNRDEPATSFQIAALR